MLEEEFKSRKLLEGEYPDEWFMGLEIISCRLEQDHGIVTSKEEFQTQIVNGLTSGSFRDFAITQESLEYDMDK